MNSITYFALFAAMSLYIRKEHMILDAKIIPNPLRGPNKKRERKFHEQPAAYGSDKEITSGGVNKIPEAGQGNEKGG